ncbi:MAG: hypothetical protein JSW07_23050 [bacterium]|nr:MAG: hypothetical protein JSW07_23050 [bacterium]
MRVITITKILIIIFMTANSCCSFFHQTPKKELKLKKEIIKGLTTETMALNSLGMPSSVATNNIGDEVWNYKNLTYSTMKSDDGKTLILWELTKGDSNELSPLFDLLITFDQNEIVKDFEVVLSQVRDE